MGEGTGICGMVGLNVIKVTIVRLLVLCKKIKVNSVRNLTYINQGLRCFVRVVRLFLGYKRVCGLEIKRGLPQVHAPKQETSSHVDFYILIFF